MATFRRLLATSLIAFILTAAPAQALGSFGAVATGSTASIVGKLTTIATANIGFLDNDPADGSPGATEAIVLSIDGTGTVKVGDILLDPGTGLSGEAGSTIQTAPGGTLDFTIVAVNVKTLLRFVDTLPTVENGGPDGAFNPGEPLFLDLDQSGSPTIADRLLASGIGVTGTVGGAVTGTQSDAVWDPAKECMYQGTPLTVSVGMRRLSACGVYAAGSNVKAGHTDLGTTLVSGPASAGSGPASRTVSDGVTIVGTTVTSATAVFTAADVGRAISGGTIPSGAWITTINSGTSVEISAPATTAAGSVSLTINPTAARTIVDGAIVATDATVTSATAAFSENDVGRTISATGIPNGATIIEYTSATSVEISAAATATTPTISLSLGDNTGWLLATYDAWIGSGAVASGHYRISGTPGTPGTLVHCGSFGADIDCSTVTASLTGPKVSLASIALTFPTVAFFDANGNGGATPNGDDRIVFDVDANGYVSPPDVRLNTAGSQPFGARPTLSTTGEVHGYLSLTPTPKFLWLDTTTNPGQVDATEVLAISIDGDTVVDVGDICLTAIGSCPAGSQRLGTTTQPAAGGTWTDITLATNAGALGYLDANNNAKYDVGDSLYLHFGTALPAAAAAGDLLVASDNGGSGTRLTSSPGNLLAFAPAAYRVLDVDGNGAFGVGDILYAERAGGVTGLAEPGDIRFNSATGVTGFGKNVKEGDADAVATLLATAATAATMIGYRDLDSTSAISLGDAVYLLPRSTLCPLVGSDVVLASGSLTLTPGNFVGGSTSACVDHATAKFGYTPAGAYSVSSTFYVDLNGDGIVGIGDIRLAGNAGGAAGSRVGGSATSDLNTPLTGVTPIAGDITFADASGDLIQAGGDTIVIDRDGNDLFTPGDLVLSTGATTSTGGGGGGGGGGGTGNPTTNPTSSPSSSSLSSSSSSSPAIDIAEANQNLRSSTQVIRDGTSNTITWGEQTGVAGYQVWGSSSPFVLLATLNGASASSYTDANAPADRAYLVTAFLPGGELEADDVNGGNVPGYTAAPTGSTATTQSSTSTSSKPGFIPGPGLVALLGVVAVALAITRRKL